MTERTKYQQGVINRYYEHFDTISIQKLSEIVSEIYLAEANKPVKLWERAKNLLSRISAADERVAQIVAKKDIQGLARLVNELNMGMKAKKAGKPVNAGLDIDAPSAPTTLASTDIASAAAAAPSDPVSPENLKRAMKAFRKRLKLTKLDDESRLGRSGNPMSGGRKSQVQAIMAPREFPKPVWDQLVAEGKLKTADGVFYELIEGA